MSDFITSGITRPEPNGSAKVAATQERLLRVPPVGVINPGIDATFEVMTQGSRTIHKPLKFYGFRINRHSHHDAVRF